MLSELIGSLVIGVVSSLLAFPITAKFVQGYGILPLAGRLKVLPPKEANLVSRIYAFAFGPCTSLIGVIGLLNFVRLIFFS